MRVGHKRTMKQITTQEAAEIIGKSEVTARKLCELGKIGAAGNFGTGRRYTYRYSAYKIAEYLFIPVEVVNAELERIRETE